MINIHFLFDKLSENPTADDVTLKLVLFNLPMMNYFYIII